VRLRWMIRKEFRQFRRDPRMVRLVLVAPLLQLILLGYAANTDVQEVPLAVCDEDRSRASRELVAEVTSITSAGGRPYFRLTARTQQPTELIAFLDRGAAQLALSIPPRFGAAESRGTTAVQVLVDGTDSSSAGVAASYLSGLLLSHGLRVARHRLERAGGRAGGLPSIELQTRVWYNPDLKSVNYMVPAVAAMVLMVVTQALTALAIVRERELGTLEQLIVTPLRSWELMLGKMIPFALVGLVDLTVVLLVALYWFRVPFRGSIFVLYGGAGLFLLCTLGLGLVISTFSRTQQQAQLLNFFFTMPSILLSGFMFPISNMPRVIQWLTYTVPMRYFLTVVRGVFLKGVGPEVLWPHGLALLGLGVALFALGALRFTKRLQ